MTLKAVKKEDKKQLTKAEAKAAAAQELKDKKEKEKLEAAKKRAEEREAKQKAKEEEKEKKAAEKLAMAKAEILPPLRELTDAQLDARAQENDEKIRSIDKELRSSFIDLATLVLEMDKGKLWQRVKNAKGKPFKSFDEWLTDATPLARASGYFAKKVGEKPFPYIPKEELKQLPKYALEVLVKLPADKRGKKEILDAAKSAGKKDKAGRQKFLDTVKEHAPESHIEGKAPMYIEQSARKTIEAAIEIAKWVANPVGEGSPLDDADAMEFVAAEFLHSLCEVEGYFGQSNAIAYENYKTSLSQPETAEAEPSVESSEVTYDESAVYDESGTEEVNEGEVA